MLTASPGLADADGSGSRPVFSTECAVPGAMLAGRYRVEAIVGQGTFGRVFRARDMEVDEVVALKEFVRTPGRTDSFLRELGILFELRHPHVIDCKTLVMSGPFRYLVCEYMEAGSLRDLLERASSVPLAEAPTLQLLQHLLEVGQGVAYAHERNVIHRDLKPENILLTRSRAQKGRAIVAKVSDFGISTLGTSLGERSCIGSPAYMAPEQFYDQYDARVDVYALGVLLYEILCGRRPFLGSPAQLMTGHLRREPEWPAWMPKVFLRVLRRALAKRPEKRFATVDAFCTALTVAIDVEGDALIGARWPIDAPSVVSIAHAVDEVLVRTTGATLRLDRNGRLLEKMPPSRSIVAAGRCWAAHIEGRARVSIAGVSRTVDDVPPDALLSLSCEGALAFVHEGRASVVDRGGRHAVDRGNGTITAVAFVGQEQTLCTCRETSRGSAELMIGATTLPMASASRRIFGHPGRYELLATSAADPRDVHLVRLGQTLTARLSCDDFSVDGDCFYGADDDGELLSVNVSSMRIARTRWQTAIAAVGAGGGELVWATREGRIASVR